MQNLFSVVFGMSITGCIVILAVLFVRLLIKHAPKKFSYILWAAVLFRLLSPVAIEVDFGIIPRWNNDIQVDNINSLVKNLSTADITEKEDVDRRFSDLGITDEQGKEESILKTEKVDEELTVAQQGSKTSIFAQYIWPLGSFTLLGYSLVMLIRLHYRMQGAVILYDKIYIADNIGSPFVIGLFLPKIYLPSGVPEKERYYIVLHEQHHIHRGDYIWKMLAFFALCIHWFNPVVWVAFVMAIKDMEMSCDEAVIKKMDNEMRIEYSESLLRFAVAGQIFIGTTCAFGENDTKSRIKNVMSYRSPAKRTLIMATVIVLVTATTLMLSAKSTQTVNNLKEKSYGGIQGFFSAEGHMFTEDEIVYLLDVSNGETYITCNLTECVHGSATCEAVCGMCAYAFIYSGKMYYLVNLKDSHKIYVREFGEGDREEFASIPNNFSKESFIIYKGKLYYLAETSAEDKDILMEIDLTTSNYRQLSAVRDAEFYNLQLLEITEEALYYAYSEYDPEHSELMRLMRNDAAITGEDLLPYKHSYMCRIDLKTLEETICLYEQEYENICFCEINEEYFLFFDLMNRNYCKVDKAGVKTIIFDMKELYVKNINMFDNVVYFQYEKEGKDYLRLYDIKKKCLMEEQEMTQYMHIIFYNNVSESVYVDIDGKRLVMPIDELAKGE